MAAEPPADAVEHEIAAGLYRRKYRELVAALTREFGSHHLAEVEDAVQEAWVRALAKWRDQIPANPGGWLFVTARRALLDGARRRATHRRALPHPHDEPSVAEPSIVVEPLDHDLMKLVFLCCHPQLGWRAQLALALKNLCGLANAEVAGVLLTSEGNVKKTLTRAHARIRDLKLRFDLPDDTCIDERLDSVLRCLYLLFNEGYLAHTDDGAVIQPHLCATALDLVALLIDHQADGAADTGTLHALAALMLLQASRLPARTDADGRLVRLKDQDRTRWDNRLISAGVYHLERAMGTRKRSSYHLQAGIAACHALAADWASTDWQEILAYYDDLQRLAPSPVVALNRTVALAQVAGHQCALNALEALEADTRLATYYLLPALKAEFSKQLGLHGDARRHYQRALELVQGAGPREFLTAQLAQCTFDY